MSENKTGALARKIALIIGEIGNVPKNGRNTFHKYDYVLEADLTRALGPLLAAHKIAFFPSVVDATEVPGKGAKGQDTLATVTLEITIVDGESGDTMVVRWRGQGMDSGDKAYYKAYTGAIKYFLMKTFLVDTGDDPEIDEDAAPQRVPPKQAAPKGERPAQSKPEGGEVTGEAARWRELMDKAGITDLPAASAATAKGYGKKSVREMLESDLRKVNDKLASMTPSGRADFMRDKMSADGDAA